MYQEKGSIKEVVKVTSISRNTVRNYLLRIEKARSGKMEEVVEIVIIGSKQLWV